jgi:hypothetical protein
MVDRQSMLMEFVVAWAEYEMRMGNAGSEAKKLVQGNPPLQQMIARITDELASSPDLQRQIASRLAIAELSRSG